MKYVFVFTLTLSIILSGCATTPEVPPTSAPEPTWTRLPHGIFEACIFFEGELVNMGYLHFWNSNGRLKYLDTEFPGGCGEVNLVPGYYEISAHYYQGVCDENGCSSMKRFLIDISDGELIEKDFEVFIRED